MKKIIALCLVLIMMFSCGACTKTEETVVTSDETTSTVSNEVSSNDSSTTSADDDTSANTSLPTDEDDNTESDAPSDDTVSTPSTPSTPSNPNTPSTPSTPTTPDDDETVVIPSDDEKPVTQPTECAHYFTAATCKTAKTCTKCGITQGGIGSHNYLSATCTAPSKCKYCGKEVGQAMGHSYTLGVCKRKRNGKECGHLQPDFFPTLSLTGDMSQITDPKQTSKKIECNVTFEYTGRGQNTTGAAKIKIQGSSSTKYRKKNYTINFYENESFAKKKKVDVGWGAQSKYCLKANWVDKTHSRNVVSAKIAGMMQEKYGLLTSAPNNGAVDGFPVAVYINGEFHGLYTMNIPKDEWLFGMDKNNPNHIVIGGGGWEDTVLFKELPTGFSENGWEVEAGPEDDATLQKLRRLVNFVLNSSDEQFKSEFEQYINLDSALNYYIMMGYAWMPDNTGKNMLLVTYDGNVWYPSLYDMDTTYGAHWTGTYEYDYSKGVINGNNSLLWKRFEQHFKKEIAERYFELREDILDPENVMDMFETFYGSIRADILAQETQKWTLPDDPIPGFDLSQIKRYLDTVVPRFDARYAAWL